MLWNRTQVKYTNSFFDTRFYKKNRTDLRTYFEKSSYHHSFNSNYFHEESYFRSHQMFFVNTQAHRNFFGTSLLVSDRGGWEWKGRQKAFMVVQCLAQGTTAGDRESNRFWFRASRYWPPILTEQSISVSMIDYCNTCTDRSKNHGRFAHWLTAKSWTIFLCNRF